MLSIAIVEDNIYALQALKEKLLVYSDIILKQEAFNGKEIISLLSKNSDVDLVLMDIDMPEMDGITATGIIKDRFPHIKVVIVTIYDNDESIFNAINAGADSYILKETKAEKIYETIIDTLNGGAVMSPSIAVKALQALKRSTQLQPVQADKNPELSVREIEVLECLSAGLSNKRIADKLFISTFTVKRHIENIYRKLQAKNRVELVTKGKRSGLI
jgi:DNA-binding NarL/FixJ family response regulator